MYIKYLLAGILIFPIISTGDSTCFTAMHLKKKDPVFNFEGVSHNKKTGKSVTAPFWELGKQKNATTDTNSLKQGNWYARVIKNIEESEYEIKYDKVTNSYASPNRKNNIRSFYTANTFTLLPRNDSSEKWNLKLTTVGVFAGRELIYSPDKNTGVTTSANKIQFNNNDEFITEYINSKEGIRQNFIITKKPAINTKQLSVKLQTNNKWLVNKVSSKEIHFARRALWAKATKKGYDKKITYNNLKAWDANNQELDAFFTVNNNFININVKTVNAVYPITIDPLSTGTLGTPDWIGDDCNQANANFGISVASAGDVNGDGYSDVIIGAYSFDDGFVDEGKAFVYHGSATGLSATPNNTPDDADQAGAFFGYCVSSAGDVNGDGYSDVIIGAYSYNDGFNDEGKAFVYYGSAAGLSATPNDTPDDANQTSAFFGISVACAGDVNGDGYSDVIIGAEGYNDAGNANEGRAFVYYGSITGLSTIPNWFGGDANQVGALFGISVASAGDVNGDGYSDVIIGARDYDDAGNVDEGRAFVYHGSAAGLSLTPNSTPDDADQAGALFGYCVSSAGDVNGDGYSDVIIGAYYYDDGVNTDEGRAFVYYGSATGLSLTPDNTPDDADQATARFGISVASAGDVNGDGYSDVIIGAFAYDDGVNTDEGRAFVYLGSATGLSATPASTPDDADQANAQFGISVASAGDVNGDGYSDVIIGANGYNDGPNTDEGWAYVYQGSASGLNTTNNWQVIGPQAGATYGYSVASAGDVNSDGYSDVIVGAYIYSSVSGADGKAFLYLGSSTGLSTTASWTGIGSMANEYFGSCVAAAGDVNGDGYGDVLVGGYGYTNGQSQEGRAYLFYGSAGGLSAVAAWNVESNGITGIMGRSLAGAGDVNGDGYSDIIISAAQYTIGGNPNAGKVYLFYGKATIPSITADWIADGTQNGEYFGISVAGLGDVNGDGYTDVIIGAQSYDGAFADEGAAFAYYGSSTGLPASPNRTYLGTQLNEQYGISVASAGDVNGDGYNDAIVGAYLYDDPTIDEGAVFVYYGSATGLSPTVSWTAENNIASSFFGYSASSAGDVNGDGYSDVIVGAREISNGQSREGALYAYYGSATGLSVSTSWYVESNIAGLLLGNTVACAGDVNGDGYSDVIASAPYYTDPIRWGAAFAYYGNNGGGKRNNLRLYNTDLTTPIQRSNYNNPNLFGAGLYIKSPLGRVKGKLVWEVKANGVAFSGSPITNSTAYYDKQTSFTDLGIAGTELKNQVQKRGRQTKIRTRVEYSKVTAITGQVYGPWRYPPGYTQGAYGMNSTPLPLTLIAFNGQFANEDDVQLQWITANEINLQSFIVERSTDGVNFISAAEVPAKGNGSSRSDYTLIDKNVSGNLLYYRLKLKEQSGDISYSHIITLSRSKIVKGFIAPNPVSRGNNAILTLQSATDKNTMLINVFNTTGQTVFTENKVLQKGKNEITISTTGLASGIYIVRVVGDGMKENYRLVVQ